MITEDNMSLLLPVGSADFRYIREKGLYYVDKTEAISKLINDSGRTILFTRPRRFGKTTFLTMLKSFFDIRENSRNLFEGLAVMNEPDVVEKWMNRYPVIHLSLKDVAGLTFSSALSSLKESLTELFSGYSFIDDGTPGGNGELFRNVLAGKMSLDEIRLSLSVLTKLVSRYYGRRVIVLIDEYDVPLDKAASNNYYRDMLDVIRSMFSSTLKDNEYLEKGILTGCLRVSKESVYTGLNNLAVYSLTSAKFAETFGFTENEVEKLLSDAGLSDKAGIIRKWYDGYRVGNERLYSVWDVIRYADALMADHNALPENYWSNSSGNEIIRRMIDESESSVSGDYTALIEGEAIPVAITEELTYGSPCTDKDSIWSLMFETGYLTLSGIYDPNGMTYLRIPNEEIRYLFITTVNSWFLEKVRSGNTKPLFDALWKGEAETLSRIISDYLFGTISYYDYSEMYYHAFLAGLLASSSYLVKSNAESGRGRPDIILLDPDNRRAAVFELKRASSGGDMRDCASAALSQIDTKQYGRDLAGYRNIIRYGISFHEKDALVLKG